jgi:hypothetical protein
VESDAVETAAGDERDQAVSAFVRDGDGVA